MKHSGIDHTQPTTDLKRERRSREVRTPRVDLYASLFTDCVTGFRISGRTGPHEGTQSFNFRNTPLVFMIVAQRLLKTACHVVHARPHHERMAWLHDRIEQLRTALGGWRVA